MKHRVQIAMLTRQIAIAEVEAPEGTEWSDDTGWGCDEGT